jgi:flagellar operon protein
MSEIRSPINRIITTGRAQGLQSRAAFKPYQTEKEENFQQILHSVIKAPEDLKFSKHAVERLNSRNINLTPAEFKQIQTGIEMAENKGVKDSLILFKNLAFIVNVPSKTVITAVDESSMKKNVFTNIDGAVLL